LIYSTECIDKTTSGSGVSIGGICRLRGEGVRENLVGLSLAAEGKPIFL
jgi:hypothetical protein